jgi:hypothetical protein
MSASIEIGKPDGSPAGKFRRKPVEVATASQSFEVKAPTGSPTGAGAFSRNFKRVAGMIGCAGLKVHGRHHAYMVPVVDAGRHRDDDCIDDVDMCISSSPEKSSVLSEIHASGLNGAQSERSTGRSSRRSTTSSEQCARGKFKRKPSKNNPTTFPWSSECSQVSDEYRSQEDRTQEAEGSPPRHQLQSEALVEDIFASEYSNPSSNNRVRCASSESQGSTAYSSASCSSGSASDLTPTSIEAYQQE